MLFLWGESWRGLSFESINRANNIVVFERFIVDTGFTCIQITFFILCNFGLSIILQLWQ